LSAFEDLLSPILEKHSHGAERIRSHILSSLVGLGRSTVSGMLCTSGVSHLDWSADYRLYAKDRVDRDLLFGQIRQEIEQTAVSGHEVIIALDDTLLGKTGRKVPGARYRRDPQGPPFGCNLKWSQRFLQCSVAVGSHSDSVRMVPVDLVHSPGAQRPSKNATAEQISFYRQEQQKLKLTQVGVDRLNHLASVWDAKQKMIVTVEGDIPIGSFFPKSTSESP
jgi:hypothetical protein